MFYNEEFNDKLSQWLLRLVRTGADVYIGDPKRHLKFFEDFQEHVKLVAEYKISNDYKDENGLEDDKINVWKMSAKLK